MSSLAYKTPPHAISVRCTKDELIVSLNDGRTLSVPLAWFPRLLDASPEQLARYELLGEGEGIHWPELDEDISVTGLLLGQPAIKHHPSIHSMT